jgi:hypothetical protein
VRLAASGLIRLRPRRLAWALPRVVGCVLA